MNIIESYPYFYPAWEYGGITRVVFDVSKELVNRGHKVTVITTDALDKKNRLKRGSLRQNIYGIDTYYFKNFNNFLAYKFNLSLPFGLIFKIDKVVKNCDIIHFHGVRSFQSIILYAHAKKYRIPYIIQAHGSLPIKIGRKKFKQIFDHLWGNKILHNAAKCIALTKTESDQYIKMGVPEERIVIIPNGLDLSQFSNLPERGTFRRKYQIPEDCKIILYIGRLHRTKGLDLLIDAFNKVIQEKINCKLVIIGPDDGYLSQIESKANDLGLLDKIKIIGFIPNNEKIQALVDSDVFVTPSFSGFPVTFLEACACGLPIITSTNGDNLDWIDKNVGFVVEYNPSRLKDAIFKIIDDEALSRKFSNQGKQLVAEQFNWNAICDQIEMHYREVIYQ